MSSPTLLTELGHALSSQPPGWPLRTGEEIRQELLRLHARWKKQTFRSESHRRYKEQHPLVWLDESEDDDDVFMPRIKSKRATSSHGDDALSSEEDGN